MNATTYDIKLRYSVDGRAARNGTQGVIKDARELERSTNAVTSSMMRMGGAIVAAFGARAAGKALIGFNSNVEDTKQGIAGMMALSKKTNLVDELANADRLMGNLQRRANTLPGTTAEYATMAGMLTQPIMSAGLGMKDLEDLTVNSVVAAKALRVEAGAAARDVDQALRAQFHSTDVFTGKLLGSIGYEGETGRAKYNALSADMRAQELKRALTQKQIDQLSAAQGQTFSGAFSTLQDTIEQTLGKVGLPLFQAITAEIKRWNVYLDKNSNVVGDWAKSVGTVLVDAFYGVKSAVGFIVDHADVLIMIAKTWAAVKIGGMLGGAAKNAIGQGGGLLASLKDWGRGQSDNGRKGGDLGWEGGYKYEGAGAGRQSWRSGGTAAGVAAAAQALGVGYAIGTVLNDWTGASKKIAADMELIHPHLDATSSKFYQLENSVTALDAATRAAAANAEGKLGLGKNFGGVANTNVQGTIDAWKQHVNLFDDWMKAFEDGDYDLARAKKEAFDAAGGDAKNIQKERADIPRMIASSDAMRSQAEQAWLLGLDVLNETQLKNLNQAETQTAVLDYIKQHQGLDQTNPWIRAREQNEIQKIMIGDSPKSKMADKPKVNVTIQRIEVQSDDPDRFAFGMVEAFRDAAKNPSSALAVLREG